MSVGKESQRDKCLSGMASMCIMKRERRGRKREEEGGCYYMRERKRREIIGGSVNKSIE